MDPTPGFAQQALLAEMPLSVAVYDRVSKDITGLQRSVEEQEEANRAACQAKGWHLDGHDIYCDNDRSASRFATKTRPDWQRLRRQLETRRYHVVVLWEVSRGDRDDLGWLGFLHMCREIGILIHITSHGHTYDVRRRRDYKTLAEEGLDSADESAKISERIRRDTESSARKGRPHGKIPYGYRRQYTVDARGRKRLVGQVPDDEPQTATGRDGVTGRYTRAGIVREIVRRILAGETPHGVAADLNGRGVPAPAGHAAGWRQWRVRKIALNPTYAGLRAWNGEVVADGIWPPLISKGDHYTMVARLTDPARRTQRESNIKYLGSGLYVCSVCGAAVAPIPRDYGMAYSCVPKVPLPRSPRDKRREASDEELAALRGLPRAEQTPLVLDLVESGVTQASVANGLGILQSTLSIRLKGERQRRGMVSNGRPKPASQQEYLARGYHVTRCMKDVDGHVQRSLWLRLARTDIAEALLAEDEHADEKLAEFTAEIAEKQLLLDQARDSHATGSGLSLEGLLRIENTLIPEIKTLKARLAEARVAPVLRGLLLPSVTEIEAEWWRRPLLNRREVIRAVIERVEILPLDNKKRFTIEESVRIVWRGADPSAGEPVTASGD